MELTRPEISVNTANGAHEELSLFVEEIHVSASNGVKHIVFRERSECDRQIDQQRKTRKKKTHDGLRWCEGCFTFGSLSAGWRRMQASPLRF